MIESDANMPRIEIDGAELKAILPDGTRFVFAEIEQIDPSMLYERLPLVDQMVDNYWMIIDALDPAQTYLSQQELTEIAGLFAVRSIGFEYPPRDKKISRVGL